ncbi:PPP4R2-domain-containing protein [Schizophyllum commune]
MPGFEYTTEHDALLEGIARTDTIPESVSWDTLRDAIKAKIEKNIAIFLEECKPQPPPPPFPPQSTPSGGLRLAPFPPRKPQQDTPEPPINFMTAEQASDLKLAIFDQLDQFDASPPFTIQRLAELCSAPRAHYAAAGKYLRALERAILVTSGADAFPALPVEPRAPLRPEDEIGAAMPSAGAALSTPTTPMFSPVPFAHADARRAPSPLTLSEPRVIGLVDELDDPRPGHLSDKPTALSAVTEVPEEAEKALEARFIKGETSEGEAKKEEKAA